MSDCYSELLALRKKYGTSEFDRAQRKLRASRLAVEHPETRRRIPERWLADAFIRQRGVCPRCHEVMVMYGKQDPPVGDHIIALAQGGRHIKSNIQAMHRSCNSSKGSNDLIRESKLGHGTVAEQLGDET